MDVKEGGSAMLLKIALFLASPSYIFFYKKMSEKDVRSNGCTTFCFKYNALKEKGLLSIVLPLLLFRMPLVIGL